MNLQTSERLFHIMKHKGSTSDFTSMRNHELMRAFRLVLEQKKYFNIKKDFEHVVNIPCSRFWVTEERALAVVKAILQDKPILDTMRQTKREMFLEIFRRVLEKQKECPDMSLYDVVFEVVNSPAPKFYMKPKHASDTIYKIKRGHYKK